MKRIVISIAIAIIITITLCSCEKLNTQGTTIFDDVRVDGQLDMHSNDSYIYSTISNTISIHDGLNTTGVFTGEKTGTFYSDLGVGGNVETDGNLNLRQSDSYIYNTLSSTVTVRDGLVAQGVFTGKSTGYLASNLQVNSDGVFTGTLEGNGLLIYQPQPQHGNIMLGNVDNDSPYDHATIYMDNRFTDSVAGVFGIYNEQRWTPDADSGNNFTGDAQFLSLRGDKAIGNYFGYLTEVKLRDNSVSNANGFIGTIEIENTYTGTVTYGNVVQTAIDAEDGDIQYARNIFFGMPEVDAGSIEQSEGIHIESGTRGTGTIDMQRALYINQATIADRNYGIYIDNNADTATEFPIYVADTSRSYFADSINASLPITNTTVQTYTLSILEKATWFTNQSSGATQFFVLPAAVAGYNYCFFTYAAQYIYVHPAAGDRLYHLTNNAGDRVRNNTVGDSLCLLAIDGTDWIPTQETGTWADVN